MDAGLYREDVSAYVDLVAIDGGRIYAETAMRAVVDKEDPTAGILVAGMPLGADAQAARPAGRRSVQPSRRQARERRRSTDRPPRPRPRWQPRPTSRTCLSGRGGHARRARRGADGERGNAGHGDSRAAALQRSQLRNLSRVLVHRAGSRRLLRVALRAAISAADADGCRRARRVERAEAARELDGRARPPRLTATGAPRTVDFDHGAANEFALADRTEARRELRRSGIIAPPSAGAGGAGRSARVVLGSRARGWSSTSVPTPADPGYDVVTESRFFFARDGVEWEELRFR